MTVSFISTILFIASLLAFPVSLISYLYLSYRKDAISYFGLAILCIPIILCAMSKSASYIFNDIPKRDNYAMCLLPDSMRIADNISKVHIETFSNQDNAQQLAGCEKETLTLLQDYTVGAFSNFLKCTSHLDFKTNYAEIKRMETLYKFPARKNSP